MLMPPFEFDFTPPEGWDAKNPWAELRREQLAAYIAQRQREEERLQDIVRQVTREEVMQVLKDAEEAEELGVNVRGYVVDHLVRRMSQTQERMQG